ncbi:hypothetical protein C8J56DRAFT_1170840 [Mycena floridula]|nr:hypothetical protein C8J56DRAFT_1170840 [Mycena floridula]
MVEELALTSSIPRPLCFNLPGAITTRAVIAAVSGSGFECTLFQGIECTGTSVLLTQADGVITISNAESVQCVST